MLEDCTDLIQCEARLSLEAESAALLGQTTLTQEDVDRLGTLIREKLSRDVSTGTRFLRRHAPSCFACFLVWKGITGYREGDYWSAVQESLGLELDANRQRRWGQLFLDFLRDHDLPRFDIEGSLKYVTPILSHGGIPDSCLSEFFESVVLLMVRRDLMDPTDPEEIVQELVFRREDNDERLEAERRRAELERKARVLRKEAELRHQAVEVYDQVVALWQLEEDTAQLAEPFDLPEDFTAFQDCKITEISRLDDQIRALQQQQEHHEKVIESFTQRYRRVLAQATEIERCVSEYSHLKEQLGQSNILEAEEEEIAERVCRQSRDLLSQPWQDRYGEQLLQLPLGELGDEITRLETILSQQMEAQRALDQHGALQKTPSPGRWLPLSALALLALALVLIGAIVVSSWILTIAGLGLIAVAALVGWSWQQKRTTTHEEEEALASTLREAMEQRTEVQEKIVRILHDLPIIPQLVHSPSLVVHQALASLAHNYRELQGIRNHRAELLQQIHPQVQFIQHLATDMGVQSVGSFDDTIAGMERVLEEAQQRQLSATEAGDELENSIRPQATDLTAKKRGVSEKLAEVERLLTDLGGGKIQAGIERVRMQRQMLSDAMELRAALEKDCRDLEKIERAILSARRVGKDKEDLSHEANQLDLRREDILAQVRVLNRELAYHPPAFPGVDKPIGRYLLYGGEPAEDLLVGTVLLLHRASTEDEVPDLEHVDLPKRVAAAFEKWWDAYSQREPTSADDLGETTAPGGQRFRAPGLLLDPVAADVMVYLPTQRYSASIGDSHASIELLGSTSGMRRQTCDLRIYESTEGLVETGDCELPLLFPDEQYEFNLKSDGRLIRRWEIPGMRSEEPYMVFDWRSGKRIREAPLPRVKVWFLGGRDAILKPAGAVLVERVPLLNQWREYGFFELDLGGIDELELTDNQGERLLIPVSLEVSPDVGLEGGQCLEGADSEGATIYVGPPPRVRVPIQDRVELLIWRLSLASDMDDRLRDWKHFRLDELDSAMELPPHGRWVDVLLADERLLGQHPVGRFTIRMRKRLQADWRATICVVPDLQIRFNRDLYMPSEPGKRNKIHAGITLSESMEFVPHPPAELLANKDDRYTIVTDRDEDAIRGVLCRQGEQETRFSITVTIPKVKWRLQGLEDVPQDTWHDTVEEIWLGDWETASELFLVVALPPYIEDSLCLSLGDYLRREDQKGLREGKARFNLLAFGEVLRVGPSVQMFSLTLPDSRFGLDNTPLLTVRTRWEVDELECIQESKGRTVNLLTVTWTEKGKTGGRDRIIRLWSIRDPGIKPILEQTVPESKQTVTFQTRVAEVPPGEYLLQITLQDPWSAPKPSRPSRNDPNTRVIEIVPTGDIRQGDLLCLCSIVDDRDQLCQLEQGMYKIRIIGKIINRRLRTRALVGVLITRTNEGWYVGNLEAPSDSELETEIANSNPVKLEYDATHDRITAIEDRYGEGAMYCCQCRKLYWSQETNIEEERKGHPVIGPIEVFGVSWE